MSRLHDPGSDRLVWSFSCNASDKSTELIVEPNDQGELEVFEDIPGKPHLSAGLMLSELLEFARHPLAKADERWVTPAPPEESSIVTDPEAPEPFDPVLAPALRLVLEFDVDLKLAATNDPITELIDLDSLRVEGKPQTLKAVGGDVKPEYDLVMGDIFQDKDRICLAWDFGPEAETEDVSSPCVSGYEELEKLVVRRVNQSNTRDEVIERTLYPAWLEANDSKGGLIRPQYQWMDERVKDLEPGAIIDYEIEAWAPDRVLASAGITVIRRYVEPLPSVAQPLAIHEVRSRAEELLQQVTIVVPLDNGAAESGVHSDGEQTAPPPQVDIEELKRRLRIRLRSVPASTVGFYGFDVSPTPEAEWHDAQQGLASGPEIRFAEPAVGQSIPWSETTGFKIATDAWVTIAAGEPNDPENKQILGLKATIPLNQLEQQVGVQFGQAVEVHIGVEVPQSAATPLQRSPLTRSRHAVHFTKTTAESETILSDLLKEDGRLNAHIGNSVDSIETIKAPPEESRRIHRPECDVEYGDDSTGTSKAVVVDVAWQHDLSGRSGFDQPDDEFKFNPVVAYDVSYFDRYDLRHYDEDGHLTNSSVDQQRLRVMPDRLYRSLPQSIDVQGEPLVLEGDGNAETLDDIVIANQQPSNVSPQFTANWKPVSSTLQPSEFRGIQSQLIFPYQLLRPGGDVELSTANIEWPAGPIWLHQDLVTLIQSVLQSFSSGESDEPKPFCRLTLRRPLVDRIRESNLSPTATELGEGLVQLQEELNWQQDPYGWLSAELIGRSCEATFYDAAGKAIAAERVVSHKSVSSSKNVAVATFFADDGETLLNVHRLTVASPFEHDFGLKQDAVDVLTIQKNGVFAGLKFLLEMHIFGHSPLDREPNADPKVSVSQQQLNTEWEKRIPDAAVSELPVLGQWLADVEKRISTVHNRGDGFLSVMSFREDPRKDSEVDDGVEKLGTDFVTAHTNPPHSSQLVPIRSDGKIRWKKEIPDRWAHEYRIAVEPIRRYDLILNAIGQSAPQPTSAAELDPLATPIHIDRSRRLVDPKAIATPLPSGFQVIILRHPASFAANASIDNQAYTQFDGQKVHSPQRRIPKKNADLLRALGLSEDDKPVDWKAYNSWAAEENQEQTVSDVGFDHPLVAAPVSGTEQGIFGADRYIFRDMPAYYEYRVHTSASAGRARSKTVKTGWVTPLVQSFSSEPESNDSPAPKLNHQIPRISPPISNVFVQDSNPALAKLIVTLDLPINRHIMPPELRPLWVDAEAKLNLAGVPAPSPPAPPAVPAPPVEDVPVNWGTLVDLDMEQQLFLRLDAPNLQGKWPPKQDPLLLPITRLLFDKEKEAFTCKTQAMGLTATPKLIQQNNGALNVEVTIQFDPTRPAAKKCLDALEVASSHGPPAAEALVKQMIYVLGSRHGAQSEIRFHSAEGETLSLIHI